MGQAAHHHPAYSEFVDYGASESTAWAAMSEANAISASRCFQLVAQTRLFDHLVSELIRTGLREIAKMNRVLTGQAAI